MTDILGIRSLSMLKMEKNFIAHIEKKYPRKPYEFYDDSFLITRIEQETKELREAYNLMVYKKNKFDNYIKIMNELADISNLVDYLYEAILWELINNE